MLSKQPLFLVTAYAIHLRHLKDVRGCQLQGLTLLEYIVLLTKRIPRTHVRKKPLTLTYQLKNNCFRGLIVGLMDKGYD